MEVSVVVGVVFGGVKQIHISNSTEGVQNQLNFFNLGMLLGLGPEPTDAIFCASWVSYDSEVEVLTGGRALFNRICANARKGLDS